MTREDALKELTSIIEYNHPYVTEIGGVIIENMISELMLLPSIGGEGKQNFWRKHLGSKCPRNVVDEDTVNLLDQIKVYGIEIHPVEGAIVTIGIGNSGVRYRKRLEK